MILFTDCMAHYRRIMATLGVLLLVTLNSGISRAALVAADHLRGYAVRSADGIAVGSVNELLIDVRGRIGYLLVTDADSARQVHVPWRAIRMQTEPPAIILSIDAEKFRRAPAGDGTARSIDQFYGVAPYWQEAPAGTTRPRPPRNLRIVK